MNGVHPLPRRVLIAGGTGFLGYHAALRLLQEGVGVATVALPGELDLAGWFPATIEPFFGNLFTMTETELVALFTQAHCDAFVYALGPDDRVVPPAPAYAFFRERLVDRAAVILRAARAAGCRRAVVLNSYFSHFDRLAGGDLSRHHPYVRARIEQEDVLAATGAAGAFDVLFLELPFIFGTMPGRRPLWREFFLDRFAGFPVAFFPKGGTTAAITVEGVAEAVAAALANGLHGERYPVGKENLSYLEILRIMLQALGSRKPVLGIPPWIAAIGGAAIDRRYRREGREAGLDHARLMTDILARDFSIDFETLARRLDFAGCGYEGGGDVRAAIRTTLASTVDGHEKSTSR